MRINIYLILLHLSSKLYILQLPIKSIKVLIVFSSNQLIWFETEIRRPWYNRFTYPFFGNLIATVGLYSSVRSSC